MKRILKIIIVLLVALSMGCANTTQMKNFPRMNNLVTDNKYEFYGYTDNDNGLCLGDLSCYEKYNAKSGFIIWNGVNVGYKIQRGKEAIYDTEVAVNMEIFDPLFFVSDALETPISPSMQIWKKELKYRITDIKNTRDISIVRFEDRLEIKLDNELITMRTKFIKETNKITDINGNIEEFVFEYKGEDIAKFDALKLTLSKTGEFIANENRGLYIKKQVNKEIEEIIALATILEVKSIKLTNRMIVKTKNIR